MRLPTPLTRDLVLIGGGHAHALVLKRWGMKPLAGARLTLIDPSPVTAYTGMLPGYVAGHYARGALEIDLVRLARHAGARLILDRACGIDPEAGLIRLEGREPVRFDVASLDIGVRGAVPDVEGAAEFATSAKPLDRFADRWDAFLARLETRNARPRVAVIGAGAGGTELALACAHRLSQSHPNGFEVSLIEARDDILTDLSPSARRAVKRALKDAGVRVHTGARLEKIDAHAVSLADGTSIESEFTIAAAGAAPWDWPGRTSLALEDGYVKVGRTLQSISSPAVYAVGDCAHLTHAPRPKAGVYAVRAAPVLYENLRTALQGDEPSKPFNPQGDYLKLISTGSKTAVGTKWGVSLTGAPVWSLKNRIDLAFMNTLSEFKPMEEPALKGERAAGVDALHGGRPLCGGCGAKTARGPLLQGLSGLPAPQRADVVAGRGDDAAVLTFGDRVQVLSTDHLRAFMEDPYLFARIAAVHALGDVWACGAAAQSGLVQLTLPPMGEAMQSATLKEVLAGAQSVFGPEGADIVGGHTATGAEFTLGFSVTGIADQALRQGLARAGDVLVLTKPIGTGVLMAAEMALQAGGRDLAACWASMARSQGEAARQLAEDARTMTDVTGFGLAGHLLSLLNETACASLDLDALPVLDGAEAMAAAGVRSSLFEANQLTRGELDAPTGPRTDLLLDPQTAGGLLAALPPERAQRRLDLMKDAGEPVWVIGEVMACTDGQARIRAR
ncbi:selenide, water dikinase SelD [Maricaulaceae bacterium MS644]